MVAIEATKLSITARKSAICSSVDLDFSGYGVVMVKGWDRRVSGGAAAVVDQASAATAVGGSVTKMIWLGIRKLQGNPKLGIRKLQGNPEPTRPMINSCLIYYFSSHMFI
jgi:hypothetical protein